MMLRYSARRIVARCCALRAFTNAMPLVLMMRCYAAAIDARYLLCRASQDIADDHG